MTRRTRRRLAIFIVLLLVSALAGWLYIWFAFPGNTALRWKSAVDGFIGGALLWSGLLFVWPSRWLTPLRQQAFPVRLAALCVFIVLVTAVTGISSYYRATGQWGVAGLSWPLFAYVTSVSLAVIVIWQVIRMIGPQALAHVLLGKYHDPVKEERVFMFIDLVGSTALARRLGDLGLQKFISRFVFDLAEPVLEHGGEIHAYVGDGVIVTWPFQKGVRNGDCVKCFFAIQDALAKRANEYQATFQAVPEIRAGLHGGPVVVGEIGDIKTAVVYSGDTVNTAARLEDAAKRHQEMLITSGSLLAKIDVPAGIAVRPIGSETLRGHDNPTELVSVTRETTDPA